LADASVSASLPGRINEVCCLSGADNFALEPADPALSSRKSNQGAIPTCAIPCTRKIYRFIPLQLYAKCLHA
jgi:hypothetical protein